jgi:hypothetical protein
VSDRLDTFPTEELIGHYRTTFSTGAGQEVLLHMLYDLGVFLEVTAGPQDVALKNYGTRLMKILGGAEPAQESIKLFMNAVMRQQLPKGKE